MKKTDEYYQALGVCNNAKDYHNMDVMVARTYVRAYNEAINYTRCCKSDSEQLPKRKRECTCSGMSDKVKCDFKCYD